MEPRLPFLLWTTKTEVKTLLHHLSENQLTSEDVVICKNIKDDKTRKLLEKLIAQNKMYSIFLKKLEHAKGH